MSELVSYWLCLPEMWILFGMLLIIAEMVLGAEYFLLAMGSGSLVLSGLLFAQELGYITILEGWMDILVAYGLLSLFSLLILRYFFQDRSQKKDINKY